MTTSSIGTSGRNFSAQDSWLAACPADITAAGTNEIWKGECYADSEFVYSGGSIFLDFNSKITDATHYIWLTTAAGQGFKDAASAQSDPLRYNPAKGVALNISNNYGRLMQATGSAPHVLIEGLQISTNSGYIPFSGLNTVVKDCVVEVLKNVALSEPNYPVKFVNCVLVLAAPTYSVTAVQGGTRLFNCALVRPSDLTSGGNAVDQYYGTWPTVRNTAIFGFTTPFVTAGSSYPGATDYNAFAVAEGSNPGSNNQSSLTYANQFENTTWAARDWRPKAGNSLLGNGVRDQTNTNDLDIIGSLRSTTTPAIGPRDAATGDTTSPDITSTGTGSTNGPFAANFAENSTGAAITLTANETVTWGALGGADAALFQKVNETGTTVQIRPVSGLDFEDPPHASPFVVTITASDAATPTPNQRTVTINFTLTNVNEPPGAPTAVSAVGGNASATVSFTPPAANGGPTPTGYTVTSSPGGLTGTGAASPITVNGLTNGTAYTFTVTATNSEGTGPASSPSNSVTPSGDTTAPTLTGTIALANLTATAYDVTCPVATDNVAVTAYDYRLNGGAWIPIPSGARTASITGRTPGATDLVEMSARDAAGNRSAILSRSVTLATYSMTVGPFALNTGSGARPAGTICNWWAVFNASIGDAGFAAAPKLEGQGATLDVNGRLVITNVPFAGSWEVQVRFPNDPGTAAQKGTARDTVIAA